MDSQLYVWARKQEVQRDLGRRALVSEAKALRAQGGAPAPRLGWKGFGRPRRDVMLGINKHVKVTTPTEEGEMQRKPVISDSPEGAQENSNGRAWRWRVEPGMEGAFQDLLGWMLPSQQGAEVETAPTPPEPSPLAAVEHRATPRPQPSARGAGEGRLTAEPGPLPA